MSQYLLQRIERAENITMHTNTEIVALGGQGYLERVIWQSAGATNPAARSVGHVFLMTGALPSSRWVQGCVALNETGFILTGPDLQDASRDAPNLLEANPPQSYETNLPGVFAVGDVRYGSVKRVAAAVGEGSACVQQVHTSLRRWGSTGG